MPEAAPRNIVLLADGTPVLIRRVLASDREGLQQGVRDMSRTSRYLRFFTGVSELSPEQLTYFTQVDQVSHIAWCGVDPAGRGGYGLGRFLRDPADPSVAAFAVAVIDRMQGKGLGTILLAALYLRAQALGVRELGGEVMPDNPIIPRWLPRLGAEVRFDQSSRLLVARIPVFSGDIPLDTPSARHFNQRLAQLRTIVVS